MARIFAELPSELASELEEAGLVRRRPPTRGLGVEIALVVLGGAQVATTVVALAESPLVVKEIAERLRGWRRLTNESDSHAEPRTVTLNVRGPNGTVAIELDDLTAVDDIARVLTLAIGSDEIPS